MSNAASDRSQRRLASSAMALKAQNIVVLRDLALEALVQGAQTEEVQTGRAGRCRTFGSPYQGRPIVAPIPNWPFRDCRHGLDNDVLVSQCAREFQVRDGHGPRAIVAGDQGSLLREREGIAPHKQRGARTEPYSAHPLLTCVAGAKSDGGADRDELAESRRTGA